MLVVINDFLLLIIISNNIFFFNLTIPILFILLISIYCLLCTRISVIQKIAIVSKYRILLLKFKILPALVYPKGLAIVCRTLVCSLMCLMLDETC